MLAKQYIVNVSFPSVSIWMPGWPNDEWHAKHWALPKYNCLPRSSDAESLYLCIAGTPYLDASYFELNWQISPDASNAAIASPQISKICLGVYLVNTSEP